MKSVSTFFVAQILILKVYILLNVLFSTKIMYYKYMLLHLLSNRIISFPFLFVHMIRKYVTLSQKNKIKEKKCNATAQRQLKNVDALKPLAWPALWLAVDVKIHKTSPSHTHMQIHSLKCLFLN